MSATQNPGCIGFLLRIFGGASVSETVASAESFPFLVRDDFLSPAELSFYHVIRTMFAERAVICTKVNLSDLFFVSRPHENRVAYNKIAQKHVDFLVCDPSTMKPLLGIELDDASHARTDRQVRDEFVGRVFEAANLPLLRIPVQRTYSIQGLALQMQPFLMGESTSSAREADAITFSYLPACPKCGVEMIVRTAARGERSGQQFYGCPNYPKCRETIPITAAGGKS